MFMYRNLCENVAHEFILISPAVSSMFYLDGLWDRKQVAVSCGCSCVSTIVQMHFLDSNKALREKVRWELHKNAMFYFKQILEAVNVCVCVCVCIYIYIYIYIYIGKGYAELKWISFLPLSFLWLSLLSNCNLFYFSIWTDDVLLKIILEFLIHINALNRMEINLLS